MKRLWKGLGKREVASRARLFRSCPFFLAPYLAISLLLLLVAGLWAQTQVVPGGGGPGTGTLNRLAKWATTSTLGDALLSDDGTNLTLTSGTFLLTGGTVTTSQPLLDLSQTWNAAGVTFTGLKSNITDTASAAGSLLLDLQVGGVSKFSVTKFGRLLAVDGTATSPAFSFVSSPDSGFYMASGAMYASRSGVGSVAFFGGGLSLGHQKYLSWASATPPAIPDLFLYRDAADVLAQRNGTNAQTARVYGTADAFPTTTNYVRASLGSSSTLVTLAAETAGTGADDVSINLAPAGAGVVQINGTPGVSATCTGSPTALVVTKGIITSMTCP